MPLPLFASCRHAVPLALVTAVVLGAASTADAAFNITVNFGGGLTTSQRAVFTQAEATWESLVTGYKPGIAISSLVINASGRNIDGLSGVLGQAGPTQGTSQGGFVLPTIGIMEFDTADLAGLEASGRLNAVILHEMAHVMGFGTLWTNNGVYTNGSGRFTGSAALAAYRQEYQNQLLAAFVPVELAGGGGTANGHWDEVTGGSANTGIVDQLGRDRRFELMTGWLNSPTHISETTIQSFADIGYTVRSLGAAAAVPEPGTMALVGLTLVGTVAVARRRRHSA